MEANTDADLRFDPNFALTLLLELGREQSVQGLVEKLINSIGICRHGIGRLELWLIEKGDICSRCPRRPECHDQTRCLHLVASRNYPLPGSLDVTPPSFQSEIRMPLGVGIIGKIATTGQEVVLEDLQTAPSEPFPMEWLRREQICGFSGTAISFKGEVLGVLSGFGRAYLIEELRAWRGVFAHHIGGAVANARAFEEIQRLKAQLEMQNAYLQEEVVEAKAFGELVGRSLAACRT